MNKKKLIIPIVIIAIVAIVIIKSQSKVEGTGVSEYKLYEPSHYTTFGNAKESPGFTKTIAGDNIYTNGVIDDKVIILGSLDSTSYFLQSYKSSDKLKSVTYFPNKNTIYSFGKDKPINILILSTPNKSKNPYDSPLYIGYYDGTCEYPAELDYVSNKKMCEKYLQNTLDFVGYDSIDEMLEDVFGDYITKDPDKSKVSK